MKPRTIILTLAAGLLGLAAGGTLVAFNRASESEPFALLYRITDKISRELSERMAPANSGPPTEYYPTIFTGISGAVVEIPRADIPGAGGGIAVLGDETLAMTFRGRIYAVTADGGYKETAIVLPDNGLAAYRGAAKQPPYDAFNHRFGRLRYNELEAMTGPQGRYLFATYTEFHPDELCHTLTAVRLPLPTDGSVAGVTAGAEDWEVVFRSQPCLPMRGVNAAIQGEEAGGRIAFSLDNTRAYLTVGEYGWNGWDSDGRTELSTRRLAQADDTDQGHIVEINLETLEARHFSKGHRNAQGITVDQQGRIWSVEHGPRGGDELNLIEDGVNYGWPVVSYGTDYSGAPIPGVEHLGFHTGYRAPKHAWLPSVGIGGLTAQHASFTPAWDGDLLAISLNGNSLFRIRLEGDDVRFAEEIAMGRRLRDIEQKDDGSLVIWTDSHEVIFMTPLAGGFGAQYVQQYIDGLAADAPDLAASLEDTVGQCAECHSFSAGENRIGPSLAKVHGAKIASVKGFEYSPALARASGRWTDKRLAAYIKDPEGVFPGTAMPAIGLEDDRQIAELVKILNQLTQTDLRD
ncbi:PQQ-dependent sugar dehydrogenase [uncultured Mameliella sp.]|uniref:PQQ-dependent sugar dehydrogenase n=1 Tax=uncultured Mameliella sp. TaxID=1447087 RepID=UPI0026376B0B|nr:PQQ-dependent sugar dehydrogenase [uncultured Mameliella sp.]